MDFNAINRVAFTRERVRGTLAYLKKKRKSGPVPPLVTRFGKALSHRRGRLYISGYEVVPQEDRDPLLKRLIYEEDSTAPFGRDSLFHDIKNRKLLGLSRRYVFAYLRRQPIVSSRQSKPKRIVRANVASIRGSGFWATDLVHVRTKDLPPDYLGEPDDSTDIPQSQHADRYFLTLVHLASGYTIIRFIKRKLADVTVKPMRSILPLIAKKFPKPMEVLASDDGREFRGAFGALLKKHKIRHKVVPLSPHIESRNSYLQGVFYKLVAMKRGNLASVVRQTEKIVNNTVHNQTGITPAEALKQLQQGKKIKRKDYKPKVLQPSKPPKNRFKTGQRVKKLTGKREKGVPMGYKRYRATHIGKTIYTIQKSKMVKSYPKYFLSNGQWAWHDELVPATLDDDVKLPVTPRNKKKKVTIPNAPKPATRRSKRLRGARVDYSSFF